MDLNLSHHAWYFPDEIFPQVMGGRRVEVALDAGIFSYAGSKVSFLFGIVVVGHTNSPDSSLAD